MSNKSQSEAIIAVIAAADWYFRADRPPHGSPEDDKIIDMWHERIEKSGLVTWKDNGDCVVDFDLLTAVYEVLPPEDSGLLHASLFGMTSDNEVEPRGLIGPPDQVGPMTKDRTVTEAEIRLSLVWGRFHPDTFVEVIEHFQDEHPVTEWDLYTNVRERGFLTLIARRVRT